MDSSLIGATFGVDSLGKEYGYQYLMIKGHSMR